LRSFSKKEMHMSQSAAVNEDLALEDVVSPVVAQVRLAIGLLQGALLYWLYRAARDNLWPSTEPYLFAPLVLLGLLVPVLLIASLGHLPAKKAGIWALVATGILIALALHDTWRGGVQQGGWGPVGDKHHFPSGLLIWFSVVGFYIAQALVTAASHDGRRIARYPTYFEQAWKLAIQLKFSAFFVGALWAVLWLGSALFMLVQLDFLRELQGKSWFAIPVICFAYSCAMHLCDVRPGIVRGIRTLALVLLSWILPVAALLVGGFLLSLPFTGLAPLWATRSATAVLLGTSALLVVLINAAFQNGEAGPGVARVIRASARVAALLLLPLVGIAVYALGLRVGEYGWTSDRIIAAACLLVAACYALGYFWAAIERDSWLGRIAGVNVATTFVTLGVLLALFSPLADPARLAVASQMARLEAGKVGADKFDFDYLRFEGARYGRQALERLKAGAQGPDAAAIGEKAALALAKERRGPREQASQLGAAGIAANLTVWPGTARLPDSFLRQDWSAFKRQWYLPRCMKETGQSCDAYLFDVNGDARPEILLVASTRGAGSALLEEGKDGRWIAIGQLEPIAAHCAPLRDKLRAGQVRLVAPRLQDLEVDGQRVHILPDRDAVPFVCPAASKL
jgi:hypothetical protein